MCIDLAKAAEDDEDEDWLAPSIPAHPTADGQTFGVRHMLRLTVSYAASGTLANDQVCELSAEIPISLGHSGTPVEFAPRGSLTAPKPTKELKEAAEKSGAWTSTDLTYTEFGAMVIVACALTWMLSATGFEPTRYPPFSWIER